MNFERCLEFLTKTLRSPLEEFKKRFKQNLRGLYIEKIEDAVRPKITFGDAQELSLDKGVVDLIVTSPPYAANAIDYMRAHTACSIKGPVLHCARIRSELTRNPYFRYQLLENHF